MRRHRILLLSAALATLGCTESQQGPSDEAVAGTEHVCSSCHGMAGRSISPTFPRLAGQQQEYLVVQLKAFRDKSRADPHAHTYMWGMAAQLSDATIDGLAADYSMQSPAKGEPAGSTGMAAGAKSFRDGIPERDRPARTGGRGGKAEG